MNVRFTVLAPDDDSFTNDDWKIDVLVEGDEGWIRFGTYPQNQKVEIIEDMVRLWPQLPDDEKHRLFLEVIQVENTIRGFSEDPDLVKRTEELNNGDLKLLLKQDLVAVCQFEDGLDMPFALYKNVFGYTWLQEGQEYSAINIFSEFLEAIPDILWSKEQVLVWLKPFLGGD